MAHTPKNAYMWEMGNTKTDTYIMNGALQLLAEPVEGSGWTKFKARIIGLERITVKGEFDSVEEALKAAKLLAYKLMLAEFKE